MRNYEHKTIKSYIFKPFTFYVCHSFKSERDLSLGNSKKKSHDQRISTKRIVEIKSQLVSTFPMETQLKMHRRNLK